MKKSQCKSNKLMETKNVRIEYLEKKNKELTSKLGKLTVENLGALELLREITEHDQSFVFDQSYINGFITRAKKIVNQMTGEIS